MGIVTVLADLGHVLGIIRLAGKCSAISICRTNLSDPAILSLIGKGWRELRFINHPSLFHSSPEQCSTPSREQDEALGCSSCSLCASFQCSLSMCSGWCSGLKRFRASGTRLICSICLSPLPLAQGPAILTQDPCLYLTIKVLVPLFCLGPLRSDLLG